MRSMILLLFILMPAVLLAQDSGLTKKEKRKLAREARTIYKSSVKHFEASEYDSAKILVDSVLKIDKSNPDAYYYAGRIYLIKGDTTAAVDILDQGIIASPRSSRLKILMAKLKLATGDVPSAFELSEAVLAFKPHEAEALYVKGMCFLAQGDSLTAVDILEQATAIAISKDNK